MPKKLKELVVAMVPVPAVFARKLAHKNRFCSCLAPNLNKNRPSLDVVGKFLADLRTRWLSYVGQMSSGESWCKMKVGNFCTNSMTGLVEIGVYSDSNISVDPKENRTQM